MAISSNDVPKIYVSRFENGPYHKCRAVSGAMMIDGKIFKRNSLYIIAEYFIDIIIH